MSNQRENPIGVFDSGVGGLTVLKAIRQQLPNENLVYLGDTARLPYGTKSPDSVSRYAHQATRHLREHAVKLIVVACNTASAVALQDLQASFAPLPVIGVVQPGAMAASAARPAAHHLVLATEATVRHGAYSRAIREIDADARVTELACELLVALAEEGWVDGKEATAIVRRYLDPVLNAQDAAGIESIILGCTHFPLLRTVIEAVAGEAISIVDSAETTAQVVRSRLTSENLERTIADGASLMLLATDGVTRFARVGGVFLGTGLEPDDVTLVDL